MFTKPGKRVLVVLFVAVIWVPLTVMLVTPQKKVSELENRSLAPAPAFDIDAPQTFTEDFERFFNDHFGFRQQLIYLYRLLEVKVFRVSRAGDVIFGRDGWMFQAGEEQIADIRNDWPYSDAEVVEWSRVLEEKHKALQERGIEYLFVFAPNKHLIYPEKLPASMSRVRETARVDQIVAFLREHTDVPFLDLRPVMFDAKKRLRPYHRTDTHWNAWGAYEGYKAVLERLGESVPGLRPVQLSPDDFAEREVPGKDLARTLSMQDELREIEIHPAEWEPECAVYVGLPEDFTVADQNNTRFSTRCETGAGRLLMFRDSYSVAMMPYLSETFEYIYYFPASPVPLDGMLRMIEEQNPDIVIEERSTRWLRKPYG